MKRKFSSNLKGKVRNFSLPKNRPLVPLYEAIVNSINSIDERRIIEPTIHGKIEIEVIRERTLISGSNEDTVIGFKIHDNGVGFNSDNMASFMEADSEYKLSIGGKGVGRFSWLKAFSSVHITSTFLENKSFFMRKFDFDLEQIEIEDSLVEAENNNCCTIVELDGYLNGFINNVPTKIETIATRIIQHCFVYFLSETCPDIIIFSDMEEEDTVTYKKRFAISDAALNKFKGIIKNNCLCRPLQSVFSNRITFISDDKHIIS